MKAAPSHDRLRGGYYTPPAIAAFLAAWAVAGTRRRVLEPSCGDGNLLEAILGAMAPFGDTMFTLTGVELDPLEAKKARKRVGSAPSNVEATVATDSFFDFSARCLESDTRFDAVVGNPPFIRYQDFPEEQRVLAFDLMQRSGLHPSRLSNAWLPFLAVSASLLAPRGRLAMVVPAELFQVGYAAELRERLAQQFSHITLVTFKELVFPDIQQEVVLLLAESGGRNAPAIRVCEVGSAQDLGTLSVGALKRQPLKPIDHASEKWTKYFLDTDEILLLREMRALARIPSLGALVDIDVGLVTGNNDFFLLTDEERRRWKLEPDTVPLVGRSAALSGTVFRPRDMNAWVASERPSYLFAPATPLSRAARAYIAHGVEIGAHRGYKCRIRREWWIVPSQWHPEVFFLRQADAAPRLVANRTPAACTDTLHRGRLLNGAKAVEVATAFNNSLSLAASEVLGRSYGGGVMTFEPSEVERIPLPMEGVSAIDSSEIDSLIRAREHEAAYDLVDRAILIDSLGIPKRDVATLRAIWRKLRARRRARKGVRG